MKKSLLNLIILLNFITAQTVYAGSTPVSTETKGKTKKISFDYNDDKKIDLIETYEADVLVKKEQDLDFDGVMDETREYFAYTSDTSPIEIVTKKDRQLKVYRNEKLNYFITTTSIDTDGDGKYDKNFTEHEEINQKKDEVCSPDLLPFLNAATNLESDVTKAMGKLNNGYIQTDFGYKIHQSCFKNWGTKTFTSILSDSMSKGLSCLNQLAVNNTKTNPKGANGALNNLMGLKRLIENKQVSILCGETGYDWKGTAGHASTSASDKITKPIAASHPYISLNPNDPKVKNKPKDDEVKEMTKTIFHEQLHNLGIRHGEGIEYPYTCETCCLSNPKDDKDMVASACKVCAGQYDSNKKGKEAYLADIVAWGEANYNSDQSSKSVINYLKENPKSQSGIIVLSRAFAGYFNPVGAEMAKLLKSKFPTLSKEDQANLDKALTNKDQKHISSQAAKAKIIAEANIKLYYENDPAKTLSYLEANKAVLKSIIEQSKKPKNDLEKYTFNQMVTDSKKALVDIWLQNYPNNVDEAKSDKAYQLLKEAGFLK